MNSSPRILALLGPTGSGKTDLVSILDPDLYEVVSCDSRQVYRDMPVGTAAPDAHTLARMPHHCVAVLAPDQAIDASLYVEMAGLAVEDILSRGKTPIFVGGTGFYFTAFRTGLFPLQNDPELRQKIALLAPEDRLEQLRTLDPAAFQPVEGDWQPGKIHPNDAYRIQRALEVTLLSGKPWSLWMEEKKEKPSHSRYRWEGWRIEMDRIPYRQRLLLRTRKMIMDGFVEEADAIYKKYGDCPGLKSLGYNLALQVVRGELKVSDLPELLQISHYQYGKKQMAWFRRESDLQILVPDGYPAWVDQISR